MARFMEAALHHPRLGYYRQSARNVGPEGDFSTAATVHPALGRAVASWSRRTRSELLPAGPWHLIEVGAGGGQLAESLLRGLGPLGRRGLTYHVVEVSGTLREAQRRRLGSRRVRWHADVGRALEAAGGHALVLSNELVDAFPCHQIAFRDGRWREVHVTLRDGRPVEVLGKLTDERLDSELCSICRDATTVGEGQRFEVHLPYLDWLVGWISGLRRGAVLTIDYGAESGQLRRRGRGGTLRGYFKHLRIEGLAVYARFGRQDLTADVNFTDLQRWGEHLGLRHRSLLTQREFMLRERPGLSRRADRDPALGFVLDPRGAGSAYLVLEQQK